MYNYLKLTYIHCYLTPIFSFILSYMESIIVNTVSSNASKGRNAIDWVVEKIGSESKVSKKLYIRLLHSY